MFDVGFWELAVVGIVALIVLGPERLPVVAREIGRWIGRMRGFVNEVKGDLDREMRIRDIRAAIERDAGIDEIKKIIDSDRHLLEDEQPVQEPVVKARADDPNTQQPVEYLPEPEEDYSYGLTDHSDHGFEEEATPVHVETVISQPSPKSQPEPAQSVSVDSTPQPGSDGKT